jgi:hypothetical protein
MVEKFEVGKKYVYPFGDSQDPALWTKENNKEMGLVTDQKPRICVDARSVDGHTQRAKFEGMNNSWVWDVNNFALYFPESAKKRNMIIIKNEYDREKDAIRVEIHKCKTAIKTLKSMTLTTTTDYFCDFSNAERKRYLVRNLLASKLNDYTTFMFDVEYIEQEKVIIYLPDYEKVDYLKQKLGSLFSAISNVKILFSRKEVTRVIEVVSDE